MSLNLVYEPDSVVDITELSNEEWLEYRRTGIGGSDAGVILGVSALSCLGMFISKKSGEHLTRRNRKIG